MQKGLRLKLLVDGHASKHELGVGALENQGLQGTDDFTSCGRIASGRSVTQHQALRRLEPLICRSKMAMTKTMRMAAYSRSRPGSNVSIKSETPRDRATLSRTARAKRKNAPKKEDTTDDAVELIEIHGVLLRCPSQWNDLPVP